MAARQLEDDGWIQPTRARLREWGAVMRSVQMPDLGHDHQAGFVQVIAGAEIESETARRIEQYLLRIKAVSPCVFQALFYSYYLERSNMEAAERMRMAERSYRQIRMVGEAMIRAYWDADDEAADAVTKKKFDNSAEESAGFVAR